MKLRKRVKKLLRKHIQSFIYKIALAIAKTTS